MSWPIVKTYSRVRPKVLYEPICKLVPNHSENAVNVRESRLNDKTLVVDDLNDTFDKMARDVNPQPLVPSNSGEDSNLSNANESSLDFKKPVQILKENKMQSTKLNKENNKTSIKKTDIKRKKRKVTTENNDDESDAQIMKRVFKKKKVSPIKKCSIVLARCNTDASPVDQEYVSSTILATRDLNKPKNISHLSQQLIKSNSLPTSTPRDNRIKMIVDVQNLSPIALNKNNAMIKASNMSLSANIKNNEKASNEKREHVNSESDHNSSMSELLNSHKESNIITETEVNQNNSDLLSERIQQLQNGNESSILLDNTIENEKSAKIKSNREIKLFTDSKEPENSYIQEKTLSKKNSKLNCDDTSLFHPHDWTNDNDFSYEFPENSNTEQVSSHRTGNQNSEEIFSSDSIITKNYKNSTFTNSSISKFSSTRNDLESDRVKNILSLDVKLINNEKTSKSFFINDYSAQENIIVGFSHSVKNPDDKSNDKLPQNTDNKGGKTIRDEIHDIGDSLVHPNSSENQQSLNQSELHSTVESKIPVKVNLYENNQMHISENSLDVENMHSNVDEDDTDVNTDEGSLQNLSNLQNKSILQSIPIINSRETMGSGIHSIIDRISPGKSGRTLKRMRSMNSEEESNEEINVIQEFANQKEKGNSFDVTSEIKNPMEPSIIKIAKKSSIKAIFSLNVETSTDSNTSKDIEDSLLLTVSKKVSSISKQTESIEQTFTEKNGLLKNLKVNDSKNQLSKRRQNSSVLVKSRRTLPKHNNDDVTQEVTHKDDSIKVMINNSEISNTKNRNKDLIERINNGPQLLIKLKKLEEKDICGSVLRTSRQNISNQIQSNPPKFLNVMNHSSLRSNKVFPNAKNNSKKVEENGSHQHVKKLHALKKAKTISKQKNKYLAGKKLKSNIKKNVKMKNLSTVIEQTSESDMSKSFNCRDLRILLTRHNVTKSELKTNVPKRSYMPLAAFSKKIHEEANDNFCNEHKGVDNIICLEEQGFSEKEVAEKKDSVLERIIDNVTSDETNCPIFLKPGKSWARSLSIINNFSNSQNLDELAVGRGKNWTHSVKEILDMQQEARNQTYQENKDVSINTSTRSEIISSFGSSLIVPHVRPSFRRLTMRFIPDQTRSTLSDDLASTLTNNYVTDRRRNTRKTSLKIKRSTIIESEEDLIKSAKEIILKRCKQVDYVPFSDRFPDTYIEQCRKIGEGVYGEVFMHDNGAEKSVIKIIPIEGDELVNCEPQKKFHEILSEIIISEELHKLRNTSDNQTNGFVGVNKIMCVVGKYPDKLVELWNAYDEQKNSENDCPTMFKENQLYIILELEHGGQDLEAYVFANAAESYSIFLQTALSLAVAEKSLEFEHRDLHWGNIMVSKSEDTTASFKLDNVDMTLNSKGVKVSVIDFTLSRMSYKGCKIFNDLASDPSLFTAQGEYQFEIYRLMKDCIQNDWQQFNPYTNILWLDYTLDKMINGVRYRKKTTKIHKTHIDLMKKLRKELKDYDSAFDLICNCEMVKTAVKLDSS
ncbi:hypothetical protein TKK_0015832 [Trichogramma kaykai]|uniref:non-specific serine/threonine protein kinase n=1 Tax=Trichogramma kaykai TaxID=54128 RepID=A0ABD2W8J3_9HYME